MKYVKWIFVVLLITSLTSFVGKDHRTEGLNVGDVAPDFQIESTSGDQPSLRLADLHGQYVLINFWASYDAESRAQNAAFGYLLSESTSVKMVSVSFDEYRSIYEETIRQDRIGGLTFFDSQASSSALFELYQLNKGFGNYLLDGNGKIIAKNISATELSARMHTLG